MVHGQTGSRRFGENTVHGNTVGHSRSYALGIDESSKLTGQTRQGKRRIMEISPCYFWPGRRTLLTRS
jgi:hypothetical protein